MFRRWRRCPTSRAATPTSTLMGARWVTRACSLSSSRQADTTRRSASEKTVSGGWSGDDAGGDIYRTRRAGDPAMSVLRIAIVLAPPSHHGAAILKISFLLERRCAEHSAIGRLNQHGDAFAGGRRLYGEIERRPVPVAERCQRFHPIGVLQGAAGVFPAGHLCRAALGEAHQEHAALSVAGADRDRAMIGGEDHRRDRLGPRIAHRR